VEVKSSFTGCIECNEAITNPICSECLAVRMQVMVKEYDPKLAKEIKGFAFEGGTTCLFCKKQMGLCAHCFSKDVYHYLEEKNQEIAEEFLSRFDFDLRQELV